MPAADLVQLADEVVEVLNDAADGLLDDGFEATRVYAPQFALEDMDTLHVTVVPRTQKSENITRGRAIAVIYTIDIGIQKRFGAGENDALNAELDPLITLVDDIIELFNGQRFTTVNALCSTAKPEPICSPEHIQELRQFTSVITLELKAFG